jgi:PAS domain S-box-containing protein
VNYEGKFLYVNEEWKRVLGYTEEDLAKIDISKVIRCDQLPDCLELFKKVVVDGTSIIDHETVFVTKDNREVNVSGNVCPIFEAGKFAYTTGFFLDITKRKKAELELKESKARIEAVNKKLQIIGSLTRHDVRNKLMVVKGNAYILKKKLNGQLELTKLVDAIDCAINQSNQIFEFNRLYEMSGEEPCVIDVGECFDQAVKLIPNLDNLNFLNECKGLRVLADKMLGQVLYTFIENSLRHGQKVTNIRLYPKNENKHVTIVYEDNGIGISSDNKPNLFTEGFSTGGSTGLGLFLSRKILDVYGWRIREIGTPGSGVLFEITIPKDEVT